MPWVVLFLDKETEDDLCELHWFASAIRLSFDLLSGFRTILFRGVFSSERSGRSVMIVFASSLMLVTGSSPSPMGLSLCPVSLAVFHSTWTNTLSPARMV